MTRSPVPTTDEIFAMTDEDYKVFENKVRRAAARHGLKMEKSRIRDPRAASYYTYHLVDVSTNTVAAAGSPSGYGLTLGDIARMLLTTPMALLADELEARGYRVSLGKSRGGEQCRIHEDSGGRQIEVNIVDFGRDPVGRTVDIRWVPRPDGHWEFEDSPMGASELADRVIATL